jgi:CHASE3 domain sensor protein
MTPEERKLKKKAYLKSYFKQRRQRLRKLRQLAQTLSTDEYHRALREMDAVDNSNILNRS